MSASFTDVFPKLANIRESEAVSDDNIFCGVLAARTIALLDKIKESIAANQMEFAAYELGIISQRLEQLANSSGDGDGYTNGLYAENEPFGHAIGLEQI